MGYADMSSAFVYKDPEFATKFDQLGESDAYLKNNGWQDGTKAVFFQASVPTGWTLDASQNDKMLRVVSGIGGGTGGAQPISTNLSLNHNHSIDSDPNHTHTIINHNHIMDSNAETNMGDVGNAVVGSGNVIMEMYTVAGGGPSTPFISYRTENTFSEETVSSLAGTHTHTNTNSLTDTNFAYIDIIVGSKNVSAGYTDLTNEYDHNDKTNFDPFKLLEDNDNFLDDRLTPFGTKCVFFQAAAPTGWTKTTTQNDKALRIVSGAGAGSGGVQAINSALVLSHTHSLGMSSTHNHTSGLHRHNMPVRASANMQRAGPVEGRYYIANASGEMVVTDGTAVTRTVYKGRTALDGSGVTSTSDGAHAHTPGNAGASIVLAHVDVIEATKNSGGAPFPYQDLLGSIIYKKLVSKQRLNDLGKNDEYLEYHTIPSTSVAFFFQATAPLTWTQLTTQNDKCLRIVSGAGGSAGGSDLIGTALPLAHVHTIPSANHYHEYSHLHGMDSTSQANSGNNFGTEKVGIVPFSGDDILGTTKILSATVPTAKVITTSTLATMASDFHDHGAATQSALSDIVLAYVDVIMCSKD